MPRYIMCPYFVDENKKSISCEDVCRSYRSHKEKWAWIDMYCDSWDWMKCPYAADLSEAYSKFEKGDKRALEEQKLKALDKENKYLRTLLGKAEKRVERQQKKIDELRAMNSSYYNELQEVHQKKNKLYAKWRSTDHDLRRHRNNVGDELSAMAGIYEQRMAFLIDQFAPGKILLEEDVKAWAGDREFALVSEYTDKEQLAWKVVFKDECTSDHVPDEVQATE